MKDAFIISLLSVLPRKGFSWTQGAFARKKASRALLNWYVNHYQVNTEEMEGEPADYENLAEFFVRPLKPGMRPVDQVENSIVSPCDGRVVAFGQIEDGKALLWDEVELSAPDLLGDIGGFEDAHYLVIYLAPPDYHRVHFPREATVNGYRYLPGHLWPVFPAAVRAVKNLFSKNERLVVFCENQPAGRSALVMVGAYGVGRIETTFCDLLTNAGQAAVDERLESPVSVGRGDELGRFHMGSTVILFFEKDTVKWDLELEQRVLMGQRIGEIHVKK